MHATAGLSVPDAVLGVRHADRLMANEGRHVRVRTDAVDHDLEPLAGLICPGDPLQAGQHDMNLPSVC